MAAFLTQPLIGLVLLLVGGAIGLAGALGFGTKPNWRSAIAVVVCAALCCWGWLLVQGGS